MNTRPTIPQLKKKADKLYSEVLRRKAANSGGQVKCYTCSTIKHWKEMQCGHFVTRTITTLRYHEKNTRPQCPGCNLFKQGCPDIFAYNLTKEYGNEILGELQTIRNNKLNNDQTRQLLENVIAECSLYLTNCS
jgi:Bacteriophage Lambda NinG protein